MLKIAGAMLCIIGSFGYSALKVTGWKQELKEVNQWILIFQKIKSRLTYQKETLEESCRWIGERENDKIGTVLEHIGRSAGENRREEFSQIWRNEIDKWKEWSGLHKNAFALLLQFPEYAKEADEELQMNLFSLYLEEWYRVKDVLEKQIQEKQKPVMAIGLIGGAMISILLI